MAPLNTIGTTREVFVTNQAFGSVSGAGSALKGVVLETGYHLGCAMDITGITLGGSINLGIVPQITIQSTVPMPTIGATIGPSIGLTPSFQVSLVPGKVVDLPFGDKPLAGPQAFITNRDVYVKIDGVTHQSGTGAARAARHSCWCAAGSGW
ncbi:MspA family porin [Nocardia sp. NBC_01009]|uniref:MspA family porin n=1 Tax=Nocardia sp. NBC_01009 TaxID=2975996 RepID=UPI0038698B5B|nr:MspA family porin [Nocardia sp. NBC_01009]